MAVPDDTITPVTGDPEDDLVLASARVAHADYLVTRDQKLIDLGQHGGVSIVTPHDFFPLLPRDR